MKAIVLGITASFFFASTFVLNKSMELGGGSWIWSAVLRYVFMLPPLIIIVQLRGNLKETYKVMLQKPAEWVLWSTVGFGIFYAPICFAAAFGPSWLVASTWQTTIVAGSLMAPFFCRVVETLKGPQRVRGKLPVKGLAISLIILLGVGVTQLQQALQTSGEEVLFGVLPVLVAAFAYPLGNRKMMEICQGRLDTFQRVLGMTIASMPFWLVLAIYGSIKVGMPGRVQVMQSVVVAVFSGIIATLLFFRATDIAKGDVHKLAAIEATQAGEVIFALLGEILFLHGVWPSGYSFLGIGMVILGMILHSYSSYSNNKSGEAGDAALR